MASGVLLLAGCNWFTPLFMVGEHTRKVPAEFTKLEDKNVLILVWAQPETLFDYPHVRLEAATHIRDEMAAKLKTHKIHVDFVDPAKVEDYLRRTLDASYDPVKVGRDFDAAMVIYIELLQFELRDVDAPDLLRGKVQASVAVYDVAAAADETQHYELEPVNVKYPEGPAMMFNPTTTHTVREMTYATFAEVVARKFYEYEEDLETVGRPK